MSPPKLMIIRPAIHKLLRRAQDNTNATPYIRWNMYGIPRTTFIWMYENNHPLSQACQMRLIKNGLQRSQLHRVSLPNIARTLSIAQRSLSRRLMFFIITAIRPLTSLWTVNTAWQLLSCGQSLRHTQHLCSELSVAHSSLWNVTSFWTHTFQPTWHHQSLCHCLY